MDAPYDLIIIGTGAGGGTLARRVAPSGKRILILERGHFLPRERENWSSEEVFVKGRYHTTEPWYDAHGKAFSPGTGYWVGGNTKVFGAAMLRLRERDFETVQHKGGVSPEWPLKYRDFEPYYTDAEALYQVHGARGIDPTEPPMSRDYLHAPVSHEPHIQALYDDLRAGGHQAFPLPLGVMLDERDPVRSACIRCATCDGFPCLVNGKSDSDVLGVRPALAHPNVTLVENAKVVRLTTGKHAREVDGVEVMIDDALHTYRGDLVVLAAGAVNSAVTLLRSASDQHPHGLANSSDLVGRNYMRHINAALVGATRHRNPTVFQKTFAVNDYYWGDEAFPHPMGHIQLLGKADRAMLASNAPAVAPGAVLDQIAKHSIDWWLSAEDLPHRDNRVTLSSDGEIQLHLEDRYHEHFDRLVATWTGVLKKVDACDSLVPFHLYMSQAVPIGGVAHQNGTCRFGRDPRDSVLDETCRAHDVDNLYVVDGSFFCSSGAVNPSLTIIANALRVGDHLLERMG